MKLTKLIIVILLILSISCKTEKKHTTSVLQLRQLVQETKTKENYSLTYFLIAASYKGGTNEKITIKVFANVDNRYRMIKIPIEDVRIVIDNELTNPNLQIEYITYTAYKDDEIIDQDYISKVYVISCPEQYLPEKLLPIGL